MLKKYGKMCYYKLYQIFYHILGGYNEKNNFSCLTSYFYLGFGR